MSGIFGVASESDCMDDLYYGTDYQSHLGTEFAGMAVMLSEGRGEVHREIHRIAHGQFKNLLHGFYEEHSARMGVGAITSAAPQPIVVETRFGTLALVTTGLITNSDSLRSELIGQGAAFSEIQEGRANQSELVAKMIALGKDVPGGIENVFDRIEGSVSLLLMTENGIYAACDRASRLPLAIGRRDGTWAVSSETCAFSNLGLSVQKYVQPGEIVFFDSSGLKDTAGRSGTKRTCAFLWIYIGYPASAYNGVAVEPVRERCGQALARKETVEADLASGVPDSGTGHAIGYAMESGLPFRRPLVKYSPGYGRSYTPPSQEVRDQIARMKLIPIEEIIRDNRVVLCEDSIVRGTQLRNLTIRKLWSAGAAEVHIRVACPPLMFPCRYALSTRSPHELAARRAIRALEGPDIEDVSEYLDPASEKYGQMVEWIRNDLNCTSLAYLTQEEMVEAIRLPGDHLCTHCWDGNE